MRRPVFCLFVFVGIAIPPIATSFFATWSVCRLSCDCHIRVPFDRFRRHLVSKHVGSNDVVSDGVPEPLGKERF